MTGYVAFICILLKIGKNDGKTCLRKNKHFKNNKKPHIKQQKTIKMSIDEKWYTGYNENKMRQKK